MSKNGSYTEFSRLNYHQCQYYQPHFVVRCYVYVKYSVMGINYMPTTDNFMNFKFKMPKNNDFCVNCLIIGANANNCFGKFVHWFVIIVNVNIEAINQCDRLTNGLRMNIIKFFFSYDGTHTSVSFRIRQCLVCGPVRALADIFGLIFVFNRHSLSFTRHFVSAALFRVRRCLGLEWFRDNLYTIN